MNTEKFIEKARNKFKNKFDYSKVDYKGCEEEVIIICPVHGDIKIKPTYHLCTVYGCQLCSGKSKITLDRFVSGANAVHGIGEYDYSESVISRASTKVKIKHNICGNYFMMSPNAHVSGVKGCPICADQRLTFDEVRERITLLNSNVIGLMSDNYRNTESICTATCSCGNVWNTRVVNLMRGCNCPVCVNRGFNPSKPATFYILEIKGNKEFTGFGISSSYIKRKSDHIRNLKANNCSIISEILIHSDGETIQNLERYIKQTLHCNNSTIAGFKTESVLISSDELRIFCENYLQGLNSSYRMTVNR